MAATQIISLVLLCLLVASELSLGNAVSQQYKAEHCIQMTPNTESQIQTIVSKLSDFLDTLTNEYEDFDIRLVKIDIERHSDDEIEDKDIQVGITINDCQDNFVQKKVIPTQNQDSTGVSEYEAKTSNIKPTLYDLDLGEDGQQVWSLMEKLRGRKIKHVLAYVKPKEDIVFFTK